MKNKRLEERRIKISKDINNFVNHSFDIVDRIHEILLKQGKEQKDLANALGKSESEISKWMTGTHNFTLKTLSKIEKILGEPLIQPTVEKRQASKIVFLSYVNNSFYFSKESSKTPQDLGKIIYNLRQQTLTDCLN